MTEELTSVSGDDFVREQGALLLKCSLLFLVGHGLSFVINFLVRGEFRPANMARHSDCNDIRIAPDYRETRLGLLPA